MREKGVSKKYVLMTLILAFHLFSIASENISQKTSLNTYAQSKEGISVTQDRKILEKKLKVGEVINKELKGEEREEFYVEAKEKEYIKVVVEQKGIDVVVKVYDPEGKQVFEVDSPNGTEGEEPVEIVTKKGGVYKIEVGSLEKEAPAGKYEVKLEEQRRAEEGEAEKIEALQEAAKLNTEGSILYQQGKYKEAEPLLKQSLEIIKKVLGQNHPSTALSLNSLALLYKSQGRYEQAEPLYLQALEINKFVLGLKNPSTATSFNNLALLYEIQGRYEQAEPLLKEALKIYKTVLGQNHPYTAQSLKLGQPC